MANGCSVTTASRKMIVRPASRMFSAISFGVFCRSAPSTSAIMRSRNVSPGLAVMRTTIWSDSTRVPPVTAERSPPDSRITGADSPVMADSSTDGDALDDVAVAGITSPATTTHTSPTSSCARRHLARCVPSGRRTLAIVSAAGLAQRVGLRLAAPFGHRLGEVGEQHREPQQQRDETGEHVLARRRRRRSRG